MLKKVICLVLIASIIELSHQQDWKNARVTKLLNETVKDKQSYQMAYSYGDNSGGGSNNNQYNSMQTLPPFNPGNNDNSYGNFGNNQKPTGDQIEPWRQYVRENEQFSCATNPDGFYPSRWCNVFYRCANYIKYEFLCAQMTNGDRAWWVQHSTNNRVTSQSDAQCIFPCILNRPCTSPGGILRDQGIVSSSTADAARILNQCDRTASGGNPTVDTSNDQFRLPNGGNNCAGVPDGGFISSSYCNVFHVCTAGRRRDFLCARASNTSTYELWWNEQTKQCDWPCRVPCNKQIFGSSTSAAQIVALDTSINSALCAPSTGGSGGSGGYGSGNSGYGSGGNTGGYNSGSGNMGYGSGSGNNNNNMGYGKK